MKRRLDPSKRVIAQTACQKLSHGHLCQLNPGLSQFLKIVNFLNVSLKQSMQHAL